MEGETGGEVEEGEQESEEIEQQSMETSVPTPDHTYSTMVSSSQCTPVPIDSTATTTSVPPNLVPISDAMTDTLRYAMGIGTIPLRCNNQRHRQSQVCKAPSPVQQ